MNISENPNILVHLTTQATELASKTHESFSIHGFWYIFIMILIFGSLGGFICPCDPIEASKGKDKKQPCSVFVVHRMLSGISGAFILVAIAIPVFRLEDSMTLFNAYDISSKALMPFLIYIIGISILGGYSGRNILSMLSRGLINKLAEEIDKQNQSIQTNSDHIDRLTEDSSRTTNFSRAVDYINEEHYTKGIDILNSYLNKWPKESKAWSWKARALKRTGDIEGAVYAIRKAIKFDPRNWIEEYNLACYLTLKENKMTNEIEHHLGKSISGFNSDSSLVDFYGSFNTDDDLKVLYSNPIFISLKDKIKRSN